jgi:hypothetical protein
VRPPRGPRARSDDFLAHLAANEKRIRCAIALRLPAARLN